MNQDEVLARLKAEFGTDFRISIHENEDETKLIKRIVMFVNGRYRPIGIDLDEWMSDFDGSLNKVKQNIKLILGEEK